MSEADDTPEPFDVEIITTNRTGTTVEVYHLYPQECPCLTDANWRPVHPGEIGSRSLSLCVQCEDIRDGYERRGDESYDWSYINALNDADAAEVFGDE